MKILFDNEYVLQFGTAKKTNWRIAKFFMIVAVLALLFLIMDYSNFIKLEGNLFGSLITTLMAFRFLDSEPQMAIMMVVYASLILALIFTIAQKIADKRRHVTITSQRFLIKQAGKKLIKINIKDIDHVNLYSGKNIEFVSGQALYKVNKVEKAKKVYLLADWFITTAKTPR